jgi:GMP synthase (glutamine-hydrolysing)
MSDLHFLIIDGYPKNSRQHFTDTGVQHACEQYRAMLNAFLPDATSDVLFPSDDDSQLPDGAGLASYQGVMWTGCNLTIYKDDPRVRRMIELARKIYEVGVPSYGSCWALQIAAVAAGGEVKLNPKGREMGIARKISLNPEGRAHPFYQGKAPVFDAFISHYDEVTSLPAGATLLATNDFTRVQSLAVTHKKGTFWAVQYHPEYSLYDMARLIVAREERLVREGFFKDSQDMHQLVGRMEALHKEPCRKDLRWQLAIDDDVLDRKIRQTEFGNWLNNLVIPTAGTPRG